MKYMLLIYSEEKALSESERQHCYAESTELTHELNDRGQFIAASPLQPVATATSIRVREGKRLVTRRTVRGDTRATRRLFSCRRERSQ